MRVDRVRLEQFKCYGSADLRLDPGVTVIHGLNGSGKSSLLEACFFALYGAKALDRTLDEVVTNGADGAVVELWFTHADGEYHVERRLSVRDDRAQTTKCVMEAPTATYEGAREVRARVTDLLRMDHEAFVNCAYVRQGEVNKLINASPADRQDMLDDLLQLGKLEEYRERASDARVGVDRVRREKETLLEDVAASIAEKEDADLPGQLNAIESELAEVGDEIDRFEANREEARRTREEAAAVLEEHEQKQAELDDLAADIEELRAEIEATEREREALSERAEQAREERAELRAEREELLAGTDLAEADPERIEERIADLRSEVETTTERLTELSVEKQQHDSEADTARQRAAELTEEAAERRADAEEVAAAVEDGEGLVAEKREAIAEMEERAADLRDAFADAPVDPDGAETYRESTVEELSEVRERRAALTQELETERERLAEAEQLRDEGKCPRCGQPVDGSPHVEAIADREATVAELEAASREAETRESSLTEQLDRAEELVEAATRLADTEQEIETARRLVEEREATLAEKRERATKLRSQAEELAQEAEDKRAVAADARERADECQTAIAGCNREKERLRTAIERLETLAETVDRVAELTETAEDCREKRAEKADRNKRRRERLAEKRERRDSLAAEFDETRVEEAREERDRAATYLEQVEEKLTALRERRNDLQSRRGAVEKELSELATLRERRAELSETVDRLDSLYEETERLQEMYEGLRGQLRQRNVETLERMLNETFDLVYENDTYSRLELDGEYRLTVHQKDGETLDPDQLSGGERALFNLSLRCAIYRLLAEGIEGTAPMPPLVLDEPTVFLDSGHVSQLVELVAAMRELGVEQILVVSHDEELVAAADDLVTVRTDARTNRSTVERADSVDRELLAEVGD